MRSPVIEYEDLVQEGMLGLYRATETYDPSLGYKFSTYAYVWIQQYIYRSFQDKGFRTFRIPCYMQEKFRKFHKGATIDALKELCKDHKSKKADQFAIMHIYHEMYGISLDEELKIITNSDNRPLLYGEVIEAIDETGDLDKLIKDDLLSVVMAGCDEIDGYVANTVMGKRKKERILRARDILFMRKGIGYDKEHLLEECGKKYGITRERVRQIELKYMQKLQKYFRRKKLTMESFV